MTLHPGSGLPPKNFDHHKGNSNDLCERADQRNSDIELQIGQIFRPEYFSNDSHFFPALKKYFSLIQL
jgi:hypothetical protein